MVLEGEIIVTLALVIITIKVFIKSEKMAKLVDRPDSFNSGMIIFEIC